MNSKASRERMRRVVLSYGPAILAYTGINDGWREDYGPKVTATDFIVESVDSEWTGILPVIADDGNTIIFIGNDYQANYICTCKEFGKYGSCDHAHIMIVEKSIKSNPEWDRVRRESRRLFRV